MNYTKENITTEDLIFDLYTDAQGVRQVHLFAYGYCTCDGSESDCRFVEYTGFERPLTEVLSDGIFEVEGKYSGEIKQYITDCTEEEMYHMYTHYDEGKCPTPITEDQLTAALPDGMYVVHYPEEKRA